jgi:hypothetical protein
MRLKGDKETISIQVMIMMMMMMMMMAAKNGSLERP